MRVTILDHGAGNLHSLAKALAGPGREMVFERDPTRALDTDVLVLPGVGAFGPAAARIAPAREALRAAIQSGLPTLGICLGMQLLFDSSEEGDGRGLGVFEGPVTMLHAKRTPQVGWNTIDDAPDATFAGSALHVAYYANRYACRPADAASVVAWSTHEADRFPAMVRRGSCIGVQFHPEKSSRPGVRFLDRWLRSVAGEDDGLPFPVTR
ncbi:MAG: imidazole glycerol phosphate synthase subunit HisH [Gemmatimonadaceae bacterium]